MARRLKAIAKDINENLDGYTAEISKGYCNTDRKIGRLRIPGKGRYGNKITVYKNGIEVFQHNTAETYRYNQEVEEWLNEIKREMKCQLNYMTLQKI